MQTFKLFGLPVYDVTLDECLERIDIMVKQGGSHLIITLGVEMVMRARNDPDFVSIARDASLVVPDSVGILWACRHYGNPLRQRVPGIDILQASARQAERYPWRVFFLGAKPGVAGQAARRMSEQYPSFKVVGHHHGYFDDDEPVIRAIREAETQVLFVALGSPAQEKWFDKNRETLGNLVAIGVGGSLDVVSGSVKRAPLFFRKTGTEWLYRLLTQPSRIGRMMALPAFAAKVLTSKGDKL